MWLKGVLGSLRECFSAALSIASRVLWWLFAVEQAERKKLAFACLRAQEAGKESEEFEDNSKRAGKADKSGRNTCIKFLGLFCSLFDSFLCKTILLLQLLHCSNSLYFP